MKLPKTFSSELVKPVSFCKRRMGNEDAFTMVEIALSIAIVAFAMVAILGIMPTGFEAQRLNREETIINQDGTYLLEAIRSGAMGLNELTNFVESISISNQNGLLSAGLANNFLGNPDVVPLTNAHFIVGMLSAPRHQLVAGRGGNSFISTNNVSAIFRAISGSAGTRFENEDFQDISFSYMVNSRIVPYLASPTNQTVGGLNSSSTNRIQLSRNTSSNLYELQLRFQWPVIQLPPSNGGVPGLPFRVGRNEKIFRTLVSGRLLSTNGQPFFSSRDRRNSVPFHYFNPKDYSPPAL